LSAETGKRKEESMASISIITATYNSSHVIAGLIESLRSQSDQDFQWVVVDGASGDDTVALVRASGLTDTLVISEPDFGIYDALNKGVRAARGDYYLVLGADDTLEADAIALYRKAVREEQTPPDMVTASIRSGDVLVTALPGKGWLYGLKGYVSQHSVGVLIRRSLHEAHGLYCRDLPIAADQLFVTRAATSGARIKRCDFVAGNYGDAGKSSTDIIGSLTEGFRVQLRTGKSKFLQVLIFILRLLKHYRHL
jgi:glycosyltransferase involved in cell wall biosynthesis